MNKVTVRQLARELGIDYERLRQLLKNAYRRGRLEYFEEQVMVDREEAMEVAVRGSGKTAAWGVCSVEGCERPMYARGMCKLHYQQRVH